MQAETVPLWKQKTDLAYLCDRLDGEDLFPRSWSGRTAASRARRGCDPR